MAGALPIDPEEWDLVIDKLVRFHDNIQLEIKELINKIKQEMNGLGSSMVPLAETKAEYGKVSNYDFQINVFLSNTFTTYLPHFRLYHFTLFVKF